MNFKCRICKRIFKSILSLSIHVSSTHKISAKHYYDLYIKRENEGFCYCGNDTKFTNMNLGYNKYCSIKCSANSEEVREKCKKTCLIKYKVDNPSKDYNIKDKMINTFYKNYGVSNPSKDNKIKKKKEKTYIKNFGVDNPLKSDIIKMKSKRTCKEKYGFDHYSKTKEGRKKSKEYMLNGGAAHANKFVKNPSKKQIKLFKMVQSICPFCILNYPCENYSIDIAIPILDIAIEFDGSYWHKINGGKNRDDIRQKKLERNGWNFIRYVDKIPNKNQLKEDILNIC